MIGVWIQKINDVVPLASVSDIHISREVRTITNNEFMRDAGKNRIGRTAMEHGAGLRNNGGIDSINKLFSDITLAQLVLIPLYS